MFIFIAFTVSGIIRAQYISAEIKSLFSISDKKEIEEAEKLRAYGDELFNEAREIENKYKINFNNKQDYREEKIHSLNAKTLDALKKATRKKIRASNQYGNANVIMIAVLNKNIDKHTETLSDSELNIILDLSETSTNLLKKARKLRGKSMSISNELLVYPYLIEADSIENLALNKLKDAYAIIMKPDVLSEAKRNYISEIKNLNTNVNVYYRIQIAASAIELSVRQLKKIYPDLSIISSEYENGWYKYSIRKNFISYSQAVEYKEFLNVEGAFIVAYVNGKKVPVAEAIKYEKN
ncbi:MAG: hypothetical protein L3J74_10950 [Bacteroidales bacterium]|nr:hypothetical protein [Bacteroidales bacterium]